MASALVAMGVFASTARAGDPPVIQYDPVANAFSSLLPYRAPFTLDVPTTTDATGVTVRFWQILSNETGCSRGKRDPNQPASKYIELSAKSLGIASGATQQHWQVTLPALHADTAYCISVAVMRPWTAAYSTDVATLLEQAVMAKFTQLKASLTADQIAPVVAQALGATADALVTNKQHRSVKAVLTDALANSANLLAMENAATEYSDALTRLYTFQTALAGVADLSAVPEVQAALAALKAANVASPAAEPAPLANADDLTKALAAFDTMDCAKSAAKDCAATQKSWHGMGADVAKAATAATHFASAKQGLLAELGTLVPGMSVSSPADEPPPSQPSYTDAAPLYISGDVGLMMPIFANTSHSYGTDASLYIAASISLIPIDKDVPLSADGGFLRRFSILGGFTLGTIKNGDGTITGVFDGKGVIGGFGLRITDYVRVAAGAVLLRQNDIDKLLPDTHVRVAPYVSVSIDLDVVGIVTGIFSQGVGLHL